jgi:hypothetical protein
VFKSALEVSAGIGNGTWENIESLSTSGASWEDWNVHFGKLRGEGFNRLRLEFESVGPTGLEPYMKVSKKSENPPLGFGFLVVSSDNRCRYFVPGQVQFSAGKVLRVSGSVEFDLVALRGDVSVEAVIVVATEMHSPTGGVLVTPGTIVGTSNLVRLHEHSGDGLFGDMFEYKWLHFSREDGLGAGQLFDVDLQASGTRPILYLNEDIKNFHNLLNETDNTRGKPSGKLQGRKNLDSIIAAQVMIQCLATVIQRIVALADELRDEDPDADEFGLVLDDLSPHEQAIVKGWRNYMGITHGHLTGRSVCAEVGALSPDAVSRLISTEMPRWVRMSMDFEELTVAQIIQQAMDEMSEEETAL